MECYRWARSNPAI